MATEDVEDFEEEEDFEEVEPFCDEDEHPDTNSNARQASKTNRNMPMAWRGESVVTLGFLIGCCFLFSYFQLPCIHVLIMCVFG